MIDWDDAFDNSSYVPGADQILTQWQSDAEAFRSVHPPSLLSYGDDAREIADVFRPTGNPKGTVMFVHGGYWQMLDKSYVSHFASGCLQRDWNVVIPSYPLAPIVQIPQITQSIAALVHQIAAERMDDIVLVGHSAGGHLVSRMACNGVIAAPISRIISVSGVHDLRPLCETRMNETLQLTPEIAQAESPALCTAARTPVTFWVGAAERPEFLRQCRLAGEAWPHAREVYEPSKHHFDIIDSLTDPQGALTREVCGDAA